MKTKTIASSRLVRRRNRTAAVGSALFLTAAALAAGCSPSEPDSPPVTITATVTEAAPEPSTPPNEAAVQQSNPGADSSPVDQQTPRARPAKIKVPNGIGMNYQKAQDLWRSSGLVVMPATDATGANRLPFLDSNWWVLGQDPTPGSSVRDGSEITATVKKYTDD